MLQTSNRSTTILLAPFEDVHFYPNLYLPRVPGNGRLSHHLYVVKMPPSQIHWYLHGTSKQSHRSPQSRYRLSQSCSAGAVRSYSAIRLTGRSNYFFDENTFVTWKPQPAASWACSKAAVSQLNQEAESFERLTEGSDRWGREARISPGEFLTECSPT